MEGVSKRNRRTVAPARGQSASEKAAQFYQSCSATYTQGGDRELDTVKQLLLRFGVLWPRLSNATNVLRISFSMSAMLDWAPVILFSVKRPMAQITVSPSHFLPDVLTRREVMLSGGGTNYRVYFGHMLDIFGRSDEPGEDVPTYDDLLAVEYRLLPVLRQALTEGKGDTLENATLDDVVQLTNNAIPRSTWDEQFREYFGTADSHGTSSYRFTVDNVRFLVGFFDLVRELGEPHVAYCLGWAAVQGLSRLTKPDIIRYYYSSHGDAARDHLLFCAILAHRYMGLAYYASYIRDEFTPELIDDVTRLVSDVRVSFREGYASSPAWKEFVERSEQSRTENASSKGPPLSFVRDSREDVLEKLFERFPDMNSTIFDNIEGAVAARRETRRNTRMARFFWNGTVRFHYLVEPTNFTAPRTFELLPVATEPLFYNVKAPLAVKYGALGSEIADAVAGLVFGDLREADNGTRDAVESQPLCLIDLSLAGSRHASPPPGWPQMTRLELAESVMSLDAAFRAFFDVTNGGHQEKLDGFDSLSGNMMMFVFWCMTKCGTSEGKYRCNDPLRMFRYFGQAFKCGVERSMSTVRDCV